MGKIKSLANKYNSMSVQVRAAIWFTICNILQNGLHLITMPIYTRLLTTEQYGLSTLYFAWVDIVTIFTSLRLSSGVFNVGMVRHPDDRDRYQSSMMGLSTVSAVICFAIYMIFQSFFDNLFGLPQILTIAMFAYCLFYPALPLWTARQRYEYHYRGFVIATLGLAIITSLFSVLFVLWFEDKGVMKIVGYVVSASAINLVFFIYIFAKGKAFFHKEYWKYALKFTLPLIPHYLSLIVLNQCDRIMISNMCGKSEAAIYGVAYNVGKVALLFTSAITSSFTPWIYEKLKNKTYEKVCDVSFSLFILIAGILACFMLFGPEVISIFATPEYMQAVYVIPPIAAGVFFTFVYNQVSTVEFYNGKSLYIMVASVVGGILNIVMNYFAIQLFGFIAAAYTSLICYILFAICHYLLMKMLCRKNNINIPLFPGRNLLLLSLLVIGFAIVSNFLYSFDIVRYILILLLVVVGIWKRKNIMELISKIRKKQGA